MRAIARRRTRADRLHHRFELRTLKRGDRSDTGGISVQHLNPRERKGSWFEILEMDLIEKMRAPGARKPAWLERHAHLNLRRGKSPDLGTIRRLRRCGDAYEPDPENCSSALEGRER